jgi:uncharacterized protein RhaS with RHS repeats
VRLLQLGFRFYDPEIGRFTQLDPIKDGLNWYAYCGGNPISAVDPTGLVGYSLFFTFMEYWKYGFEPGDHGSRKTDPYIVKINDVNNLAINTWNIPGLQRILNESRWTPRTIHFDPDTNGKGSYRFPPYNPEASAFGLITLHLEGTLYIKENSYFLKGKLYFTDEFNFDRKNENKVINSVVQWLKGKGGHTVYIKSTKMDVKWFGPRPGSICP